jgi:protein phosphatase
MKRLTEEEIANFQYKNVIVRALGMKDTVKVDTKLDTPQPGDLYILCSDGLSGPVSDKEISELVQSTNDLKSACSKLIERANANGGPDNITVVLAKWIGKG